MNETPEAARTSREWEAIIGAIEEKRASDLNAEGQMTDAVLERVSQLEHVTALNLNGSKQLTDAGLRHLARMPQLRQLHVMGCEQITDMGLANLTDCRHLERVDLSATQTGDGAIRSLAGKPQLRHFRSGRHVTDAGLPLLHQFPVFKNWQGGEISMALLKYEAEPNNLFLRGSFTDKGIASLVGLDGLFALNLAQGGPGVTAAALAPLVALPNLGWLAFDATDEAMPYISALPHLRFLMCQDTVAGDEGFAALSRSRSIEYIWGRRCHNLTRRGFAALAEMPALRALSVSCKNVDDAGVSALPRFPALRELMPMDVPDEGYRHVGRCERLESLVLMYCRGTTDVATEHIAGLRTLKSYFASNTGITDRSMEILGGMTSLERVTFYGCPGVTDAGVAKLAGLPRLREVRFSGPHITPEAGAVFPPSVHAEYADG